MSEVSAAGAAGAAAPAAGLETAGQQQQTQQQQTQQTQGGSAGASHKEKEEEKEKKQSSQTKATEKEEKEDLMTGPEVQGELNRLDREKLIVSNKILELQQDLSEHRVVLEAFQNVEKTRSCFRLVGGVLVQRTVGEVQPVLETHKKQVEAALQALERELDILTKKQTEYSRRYLQFTGQSLQSACARGGARGGSSNKDSEDEAQLEGHKHAAGGAGVLV